jgi:hypothetical protein
VLCLASSLTKQQALKRENSVVLFDECICGDDECGNMDDIADSDVAEDDKEEVGEPLDLIESGMQGFVMSH